MRQSTTTSASTSSISTCAESARPRSRCYSGPVTRSPNLGKRDATVIAALVALSAAAQTLAAIYFDSTGSLLALAGSALVFLSWVALRFR